MDGGATMAFLGVLLLLGVIGAAVAVAWTNQGAIEASAGTLNMFGSQVSLTTGQLFLLGAAAGAVTLLALYMTVGGTRRRMARTSQRRRDLHERERELQARLAEADASRTASEHSAQHAAARNEELANHR
jgi:hypothetical protein